MDYNVYVTIDAEIKINEIVNYLINVLKNKQAATTFLNEFEIIKEYLKKSASVTKLCDNKNLKCYGYRRINFKTQKYFVLYRINDLNVYVDEIFHELQDFEKKFL